MDLRPFCYRCQSREHVTRDHPLDPLEPTLFAEPYDGRVPAVDQETSRASARSLEPTVGSMRADVFDLFARSPRELTDDEIEVALDMRHQTASARRRELAIARLVADTGARRKTRSGRSAIVWMLA